MIWQYEKTPLNGGAPGDAFKSIFNGSGKSHAETLAREAIQNSVDAATKSGSSVRVDFRFARVDGEARESIEEAAGLSEMRAREPGLGLLRGNALVELERPLELLFVDDYETTGLRGDPTSPSSNLRKLLMDLGGAGKRTKRRLPEAPTVSARRFIAPRRASARFSLSAVRSTAMASRFRS